MCDVKFFFTKALADATHDILRWRFIPWPYALEMTAWNAQEIVGLSRLHYELFLFPCGGITHWSRGQKSAPSECQYPRRRAIWGYWRGLLLSTSIPAEEPFERDTGWEFNWRLRQWWRYRDNALATLLSFLKPCDRTDNTKSKKASACNINTPMPNITVYLVWVFKIW